MIPVAENIAAARGIQFGVKDESEDSLLLRSCSNALATSTAAQRASVIHRPDLLAGV